MQLGAIEYIQYMQLHTLYITVPISYIIITERIVVTRCIVK